MVSVFGVLIDTVSIQQYIFGSNKLRENIGASYLIQEIYRTYLKEVLDELFPVDNINLDLWKSNPGKILMNDPKISFEVGYIGGGNALLFFRKENKAQSFIRDWTRNLLVKTPGINTAVACEEFDIDDFCNSIISLIHKLNENKSKYIMQTIIPRHGITAECSHSGLSLDVWNEDEIEERREYVSSVVNAKIIASETANNRLSKKFKCILGDDYCFTDKLDELGQKKGEDSHIAIVHIDGNDMGRRFQNIDSLSEIRKLSISVKDATENSFKEFLKKIIDRFPEIETELGFENNEFPTENGKKIIPLRPIIIGGDDITFVCNGKLGIYFAQKFMEKFSNQKDKNNIPFNLSSCAGIAITKTKYPFFRGYELSEQLCHSAKEKRKEKNDNDSWLDFHISYGGFSGTLKEIREFHYKTSQGSLLFRPYKLGYDIGHGFINCVQNTKKLKETFPRSKIHELKEVLTFGETASQRFVTHMEARGDPLPEIQDSKFHKNLWEEYRTPYFDMIELIEFYPFFEPEVK